MCSVSLWFLCILSLYNVLLQYIYNCITLATSEQWTEVAVITYMSDILHLLNILLWSPWLDQHLMMTWSTPNNLINISISSHLHNQRNEINYQCLKNTFVLVLRRSVTLNNSNILASNVPSLVYKSMYYCRYPLLMLSLIVVYSGFIIINYEPPCILDNFINEQRRPHHLTE